jgi:ATP-dependent Lon protease
MDQKNQETGESPVILPREENLPPIPSELPLMPLEDLVIYPYTVVPLIIKAPKLVRAIDMAMAEGRIVGAFMLKDKEKEELYQTGSAVFIHRMMRFPDGTTRLMVQGMAKIVLKELLIKEPYFRGRVEVVEEIPERTTIVEALMRAVLGQFQRMTSLAPYMPDELQAIALSIDDPLRLVYFIATMIRMKPEERQEILEINTAEEKLKKLSSILSREIELLELGTKIQSQVQEELSKLQREHFLREQLKAIKRELGEDEGAEIKELREKILQADLPDYVRKEAERELSRLERIPPASAEYGVIRTYIEWLIELPWNKVTEDDLNLERAKRVLDEDHYDLKEVKERILEYLAVRKLKKERGEGVKGPILCFLGPPGVGKTSLGRSIARALGRQFIRISLGGMRDEAEIRGHRRTYVGAMPGAILQAIRRAGTKNPVFMLDEIDKIGADFRGDPAAALLEVLDPEQNHSFRDHYIDLPFDLSQVFFIATANVLDTIHPALRDRMEILRLPGYTEEEKVMIARRYLIPRQMKENGLESGEVAFSDEAIRRIVTHYTREAGVRNLEREIAQICRKLAFRKALGEPVAVMITPENLKGFLGPEKFYPEIELRTSRPGVAIGLAWTPTGGAILFIEALKMPGKGNLILTGSLGEVMKESAQAALSYVRSRSKQLGIDDNFHEKFDIHVHVPEGATPKDGPSAGITIACAIASALTGRLVRSDIAMSGEITLSGVVLPVGGIKEKVLAAKSRGIFKVILPEGNRGDVEELGEDYKDLKEKMTFFFVKDVDEVFNLALS